MKVSDIKERIELEEFPTFYGKFLENVKHEKDKMNALELECEWGKVAKNIDNVESINDFVKLVFYWGGKTGNRVSGLLYKHQSEKEIAAIIKESSCLLEENKLKCAIEKLPL